MKNLTQKYYNDMENSIQMHYIGVKEEILTLDVDDLIGILQQLEAVALGYDAMGFSCTDYEDKPLWKWESK